MCTLLKKESKKLENLEIVSNFEENRVGLKKMAILINDDETAKILFTNIQDGLKINHLGKEVNFLKEFEALLDKEKSAFKMR